ncbi:nitroreductase/quinone reductase family protein [Streptomyces sp. NPDC060194]|uniref:nitroreductase/quinone reductase family protein n=1 Tax=Streptomyces sp. NPDC060194 TaxID=3347069 RepID=UPI0036576E4C
MPASFNQSVIDEFRARAGRVGGPFEGGDLLLLTTTGARSGKRHTVPLGYVRDAERGLPMVIGSAGGAHRHPAWYHNLLAHPLVEVEIGTEVYEAVAVPAEGEARERLFAQVTAAVPGYGDYQEATSRVLPVVVLEPAEHAPRKPVANLADKMVAVHDWLRAELAHVEAEVAAYFAHRTPGASAPPLGLRIRQHCLAFCQTLDFHHRAEDAHAFPGLARQHPELAPAFERLRAEHVTVARLQTDLVALLADVEHADPVRFRSELAQLVTELTAHLDYEEEVVLPPLAAIPFPPAPA